MDEADRELTAATPAEKGCAGVGPAYDEERLQQLTPLALAYLGDAVYELAVRRYLIDHGLGKSGSLHTQAVRYVNAERQSRFYAEIEPLLSEQERAVYRRGRNAKSGHQPPHTSAACYRRATGLEALIGWWHLRGEQQRLQEILARLFVEEDALCK